MAFDFIRWRVHTAAGAVALVLATTAVATAVRAGLDLVPSGVVPFATYFLAILVTALLAGPGAGLGTLALGALVSGILFTAGLPGTGPFAPATVISFGLYLAVGGAIVAVAAALGRSLEVQSQRERRLVQAERHGGVGDWDWDPATGTVTWSENLHRLFGTDPATFGPTPQTSLSIVHPDDRARLRAAMAHAITAGQGVETEFRAIRPDGTERHFAMRGEVVLDRHGRVARALGTAMDVTARKAVEADLAAARDRAELLSREMNHRIKNNLARIVGLLGLQAAATRSDEARQQLEAAQKRIFTIAALHDNLSHGVETGRIELASYLGTLGSQIQQSAGTGGRARVLVTAEPVELPPDTAILIGLIVNELATNAMKHAFRARPGGEGTITIAARARDAGLTVTVADDGDGVPADRDPRSGGLGLALVEGLVGQMNGRMEIRDQGGHAVEIRVPLVAKDAAG